MNGLVRGGSNVRIFHQVTIGADREVAVIGNDILMGAGAKIIGPVTIGDGVRIGAKKRFQNLVLRGVSRFAQRIAAANS
jgi:serine acetyltransferase